MKSFLIAVGKAAESVLPVLMTASSSGITKSVPEIFVHEISEGSASTVVSGLAGDVCRIAGLFDRRESGSFFRTLFRFTVSRPNLPSREEMAVDSQSAALMDALRGKDIPLSFHSDRDAVEWSAGWLLRLKGPEQFFPASFLATLSAAASDISKPVPRLVLLCDPGDAYSSGMSAALLRFLSSMFLTRRPYICLVMTPVPDDNTSFEQCLTLTKQTLSELSSEHLVRESADADAHAGADAAWLISLPSGLAGRDSGNMYSCFAVSRLIMELFASNAFPEPGLHVHQTPLVLTARSLGDEFPGAAQFFRFAVWMLSGLFDRIREASDSTDRRRSFTDAFRSKPLRTLFQSSEEIRPALDPLKRFLTAYASQCLLMFRQLPENMRSSHSAADARDRAVRCCGQYVTRAAEYSVSDTEAKESGIAFKMPVHRESMADTDEEIILHRLEEMKTATASALHERDVCFADIGFTAASLALQDCLDKCRSALQSAKIKLSELPRTGEAADTLNIRLQERRIRYLEAAVRICIDDLRGISSFDRLSALTPARSAVKSVFANMLVSEKALAALQNLLTSGTASESETGSGTDDRDNAARSLAVLLPELLSGCAFPDEKALMKSLVNACRSFDNSRPLAHFLESAFTVCASGLAPSLQMGQTSSDSIEQTEFAMLPDLAFSEETLNLQTLPGRVIVPEDAARMPELRGLTALLLLSQYRMTGTRETRIEFMPISRQSSVFASVCLDAFGVRDAQIVHLRRDDKRLPLCLMLPARLPVISVWTEDHAAMLPGFVIWRSPDTGRMTDPSDLLCDTDRGILSCQLTAIRAAMDSEAKTRLDSLIQSWHRDLARSSRNSKDEADPLLSVRLSAACGLYRLGSYGELARNVQKYRDAIEEDLVASCLAGSSSVHPCRTPLRSEVIYTCRGVPFARESAAALLESVHAPEEAPVLSYLESECRLLFRSSDNYRDTLVAGLRELLDRFPKAASRSRTAAGDLLESASAPIPETVTTLTAPFDETSPAFNAILNECLGERLARSALKPFTDMLIVFPAMAERLIGDSLLSAMCVIASDALVPESSDTAPQPKSDVQPDAPDGYADEHPELPKAADAVLPPLSPEFAVAMTLLPEGTRLIEPGFLRFERRGNCIRTELLLNGAFPLKLVRDYPETDTVYLYSQDIPTAAVWPAVPFAPGSWNTYFAYAHCSAFLRLHAVGVSAKETPLTVSRTGRACAEMPEYPLCFIFRHDDKPVGALPNILPAPSQDISGAVSVCVDAGSYCASVVLQTSEGPKQLPASNMLRLIIQHPANAAELLRTEFISELPLTSVFPNALKVHTDTGISPGTPARATLLNPLMPDDLLSPDVHAGTAPVGNSADACKALMHEIMLEAALHVRLSGSENIAWKFALPEQDPPDRRRETAECLETVAKAVAAETGLLPPDKGLPISYAAQSAALGAYFRRCLPAETGGGFVSLDIGHSFTSINVFLRGQDSVVWSARHPLSLPDTLLPFFINTPELLRQDYSFTGNDKLLSDIRRIEELLSHAADSVSALRRAGHAISLFIADNSDAVIEASLCRAQGGSPASVFSVMLAHQCWIFMLAGLIITAVSASATGARELPDAVPLCVSGMGSKITEALPPPYRESVFSFISLCETTGIRRAYPVFSSDRKFEIPIGLSLIQAGPPDRITDRGASVPLPLPPENILSGFLRMFRNVFPQESALLFPGFFAQDVYSSFTPYAQDMISAAAGKAFAGAEAHTGYACLASCLGTLFRLMIDSVHDNPPGGYAWNA